MPSIKSIGLIVFWGKLLETKKVHICKDRRQKTLHEDLTQIENFNSFKQQMKLRIVQISENHPT